MKQYTLSLHKKTYLLENQGNYMFGYQQPSDLELELIDEPHQFFTRRGNYNLVYIEKINSECICKNQYHLLFTFLDKQQYQCILPNYQELFSKTNIIILTINNFGLPNYQGNKGKLFIIFKKKQKKSLIPNNLLYNTTSFTTIQQLQYSISLF
tara:strand:+ start:94 stop:552 length:459 start_codon:yes stop_codon:yes gene_type:complete